MGLPEGAGRSFDRSMVSLYRSLRRRDDRPRRSVACPAAPPVHHGGPDDSRRRFRPPAGAVDAVDAGSDGDGNDSGLALLWPALVPSALTQVLLVFFLGHQFAFLGLGESSSALLVVFGEFALFTAGLTAAFCLAVMGSAMALQRLRMFS